MKEQAFRSLPAFAGRVLTVVPLRLRSPEVTAPLLLIFAPLGAIRAGVFVRRVPGRPPLNPNSSSGDWRLSVPA